MALWRALGQKERRMCLGIPGEVRSVVEGELRTGRVAFGSLVVGVPAGGRSSSRPHHLLHRLTGTLPVGGLVDGPVSKAINDGLKFEPFGDDELAAFQSDVAVYHDVFADFSTNEPILDGTVSLLLLVESWDRPTLP